MTWTVAIDMESAFGMKYFVLTISVESVALLSIASCTACSLDTAYTSYVYTSGKIAVLRLVEFTVY